MTVIPTAWRYKLADNYLAELITCLVALSSGAFGVVIVALPEQFRQAASFRQAFEWLPPFAWGLPMLVFAVLMLGLLTHSRIAAALPTFLLAIMWVAWVVPIAMSPGFIPSAPIVYTALALFTMLAGFALMVPRREV